MVSTFEKQHQNEKLLDQLDWSLKDIDIDVVIPRVETAVMSIRLSAAHEPNSVILNSDQKEISGKMEDIPLMTEPSRRD